jgi:hypothetical protein
MRFASLELRPPHRGPAGGARGSSHDLPALLLYTDGLVEAANASDELFGLERVKTAVASSLPLPPNGAATRFWATWTPGRGALSATTSRSSSWTGRARHLRPRLPVRDDGPVRD